MEYYSSTKRNEITQFLETRMGLEIIILSDVTQRKILDDSTYMRNLTKKIMQMNLYTEQNRPTDIEDKLKVTGGWGGVDEDFGIDINTLLCIK